MLRLVDNRNAATLAVIAAVLFGLALVGPFMTVERLGRAQTYSLVGGIAAMARDGKPALAAVVFVFSIIFPLAKLGLVLASTSRLVAVTARTRRLMHAIAERTARYSLVDVVVIALLIIILKVDELVQVQARWGTFSFLAAALVAMAAGLCVDVGSMEQEAAPLQPRGSR